MPIDKNDFDKGRSDEPIISKIQKFLESNKDKAFTEEEIIGHLYPDHIAWPGDTIAFSSAVLILAYAEKIELRYINTSILAQGQSLTLEQNHDMQFLDAVTFSS
jgi:hypothetical protein